MTEPSPSEKTVPVTIRGRTIMIKAPTGTQAALMGSSTLRMTRLAEKLGGDWDQIPAEMIMPVISKILDVLQSMCVDPMDQLWLEDEMLAGRLEFTEMTPLLGALNEDQEKKPVNRRARRAG